MKRDYDFKVKRKLNAMELAEMCTQIEAMAGVGVHIGTTMEILQKGGSHSRMMKLYEELHRAIMSGMLFSEAMEHLGMFPEMMINMFRSAEATGQMERTANRLAVYYQKEHRLKNQIQGALLYPKVLFLLSIWMILFVFWFIIPEMSLLYEDMELSAWTGCLLCFSAALMEFWYMIFIIPLVLKLCWTWMLTRKKIRLFLGWFSIHMPFLGRYKKILYTACFSRVFSSLYGAGLPLIHSLELTSHTIGNRYIEKQILDMIGKVRNGTLLSEAIGTVDGLDEKLSPIIFVGEETGRLDVMLERLADNYEHEAEVSLSRLTVMVEPMMILLMGLLIGSILWGIMSPVWNMYGMVS